MSIVGDARCLPPVICKFGNVVRLSSSGVLYVRENSTLSLCVVVCVCLSVCSAKVEYTTTFRRADALVLFDGRAFGECFCARAVSVRLNQ